MGAYLSEPVTEKISSDAEGEYVRYGASSMQGWRVSQEDAHNCLIDFDSNTSLFAVYDGHGGHEVALYCSQKLPNFIKESEAYKKCDFTNALIDSFLGFDSTIASREVVAVLKELAGSKDNDQLPTEVSSDEEENVSNLYEEASMPIEQVIEKYQSSVNCNLKKLQTEKLPNSPFLRARKAGDASTPSCSSSSDACSSKAVTTTSETNDVSSTNTSETLSSLNTNNLDDKQDVNDEKEVKDVKDKDDVNDIKNDVKTESTNENDKQEPPDSSNDTKAPEKLPPKIEINGEVTESCKNDSECTSTTTRENGEIKPSPKGKGKAIAKKSPAVGCSTRTKSLRIRNAKQLYNKLLDFEDDSESDENDETFEGVNSNSSSEAEDAAESSEGAEDEEDEEEEMIDDDYDNEFTRNITEEPGSDSGCTAVLALLSGNDLYVANAGDSRCIVCRKGQAIEMSFDHKPEDEPEMARIIKAGGKVTQDGRVNGGLNLSRAIGDHAYKQNKELSDREQMITALPDVRTLTLNPEEDEFMVLACDGIWNFMSSQEVVEFIRPRLQENKLKLSEICEEMFDHCLAPNTMGDGTGCDNMTAVIVHFKSMKTQMPKRCASPAIEENSTKKQKTEAK